MVNFKLNRLSAVPSFFRNVKLGGLEGKLQPKGKSGQLSPDLLPFCTPDLCTTTSHQHDRERRWGWKKRNHAVKIIFKSTKHVVLRQALPGHLSPAWNTALGIEGGMRKAGSGARWTVKTLSSACVLSLKTTGKPGARPVGARCMGFPSDSHLATNGLGEEDTSCLAELRTLQMSLSTSLLHIATIPHRASY